MGNEYEEIRTQAGLDDHTPSPYACDRAPERFGEIRGQARREGWRPRHPAGKDEPCNWVRDQINFARIHEGPALQKRG